MDTYRQGGEARVVLADAADAARRRPPGGRARGERGDRCRRRSRTASTCGCSTWSSCSRPAASTATRWSRRRGEDRPRVGRRPPERRGRRAGRGHGARRPGRGLRGRRRLAPRGSRSTACSVCFTRLPPRLQRDLAGERPDAERAVLVAVPARRGSGSGRARRRGTRGTRARALARLAAADVPGADRRARRWCRSCASRRPSSAFDAVAVGPSLDGGRRRGRRGDEKRGGREPGRQDGESGTWVFGTSREKRFKGSGA